MKNIYLLVGIVLSNFTLAYSQPNTVKKIPCDPIIYSITLHTVRNPDSTYYNTPDFNPFLSQLNSLFAETCIQFSLCRVDTIHDYNFFNLIDEPLTNEVIDMKNSYFDKHSINIYWASNNFQFDFEGICKSNNAKPGIVFDFSQFLIENQIVFSQFMAGYFGLNMTASPLTSKELADRSNGQTSADSIWDTPADPINYLQNMDTFILPININKSQYYYNTTKDANGDYYNPMITNFMSNYPILISKKCLLLTRGQLEKIALNEQRCRKKRWE